MFQEIGHKPNISYWSAQATLAPMTAFLGDDPVSIKLQAISGILELLIKSTSRVKVTHIPHVNLFMSVTIVIPT